jgi:hypothetical protein
MEMRNPSDHARKSQMLSKRARKKKLASSKLYKPSSRLPPIPRNKVKRSKKLYKREKRVEHDRD